MRIMNVLRYVLVCSSTLLPMRPADAVIPVTDHAAIVASAKQYAMQAAREVQQLGYLASQLNNLVEMVRLDNLASTILGEGMGGEFSQLMQSAQGLYQETSALVTNVQTKRLRLQQELDQLMLPENLSQMSPTQLLGVLQRYREFFGNDTMQARAVQAEGIDLQAKILRETANGVRQSDRSRSALSAVQSGNHILAAVSSQLETMNYSVGTMAMTQQNEIMKKYAEANVQAEMERKNSEAMNGYLAKAPVRTNVSPVNWGRP